MDRTYQEIILLREEVRIKVVRMRELSPHRRPCYPPTEWMSILRLKAARSWNLEQTAQEFLVTADAIRSWLKRVDEARPERGRVSSV